MADRKDVRIIITDDDDGHAELIREGLVRSGIRNPISRFTNGEELWQYMTGVPVRGEARARGEPCLLLLDINMPRMDGVEVLARIKQDAELKETPVIMLTTTDDPREVERCYQLGCNIYITKPVDFGKFTETLHRLGLFLQVVRA